MTGAKVAAESEDIPPPDSFALPWCQTVLFPAAAGRVSRAGKGAPKGEPMTGHEGAVYSVDFNHDDSLLASVGMDGTTRLWDVKSGKEVRTRLPWRVSSRAETCQLHPASVRTTQVQLEYFHSRWLLQF